MRARIKLVADRIDALSGRERGIVFAMTISVALFAWHALLYQPLDARRGALEDRVAASCALSVPISERRPATRSSSGDSTGRSTSSGAP